MGPYAISRQIGATHCDAQPRRRRRNGKVLVMLAVLMPTLCGIVGLVIDGGLMMKEHRSLQHAADAAATAAATDLRLGHSAARAVATATEYVQGANGRPEANVAVHIPPISGKFAGRAGYVEIDVETQYKSKFFHVLDGIVERTVRTRAVAGVDNVTAGAAIVVLDPAPAPLTVDIGEIVSQVDSIVLGLLDETLSVTALNQVLPQLGLGQLLNQVGLGQLLNSVLNALTSSLSELADNNVLVGIVENLLSDVLTGLPLAPLPGLTAGFEIEGLGRLRVDGAILVNNEWGGVDENGELVGIAPGLPYGVACMPVLATTRVLTRDLRVAGGVDRPENYQPFSANSPNPLQANRLPVPDPFQNLPVPTTSSDSANVGFDLLVGQRLDILSPGAVLQTLKGEVLTDVLTQVLGPLGPLVANLLRPVLQPLLGPAVEDALLGLLGPGAPPLTPGVYDSIHVVSILGGVTFQPGVYIVRGNGPIPLLLVGDIRAEGVMFYITNSPGYDGVAGFPDVNDGESAPSNYALPTLLPSAVILPILGSRISGLDDPDSPFHNMLIYQRRHDRRLILIAAHHLVAGGSITGTIYSKWGHVVFLGGMGSYDVRLVAGTMRVLAIFDTTIAPSQLLPPARDVLLVE